MRNLFFILSVFATLLTSSCRNINTNILFKIPKGDDFEYASIPLVPEENFKLTPGDRFSFIFGTNNGEKIKNLNVILNGIDIKRGGYGYDYGNKGYGDDGYYTDDEIEKSRFRKLIEKITSLWKKKK